MTSPSHGGLTSARVSSQPPDSGRPSLAAEHEARVLEAIRNTAFGTIEIVIHQSRIVQLTRSEKVRFEPN